MPGNDSRAARGAPPKSEPAGERGAAQAAALADSRQIAVASHNLRQPLQSISMLNAALSQRIEDPAILEIVALQRKSLDEVNELLENLLAACSPEFQRR